MNTSCHKIRRRTISVTHRLSTTTYYRPVSSTYYRPNGIQIIMQVYRFFSYETYCCALLCLKENDLMLPSEDGRSYIWAESIHEKSSDASCGMTNPWSKQWMLSPLTKWGEWSYCTTWCSADNLENRLSGRVKHAGPQSYLTKEEENKLVDFLIECCKMGNGKTKREILQTVKRLVEKKKELRRSYP